MNIITFHCVKAAKKNIIEWEDKYGIMTPSLPINDLKFI